MAKPTNSAFFQFRSIRNSASTGENTNLADFGTTSRGYRKLMEAVKSFRFSFAGKTVLDIGASTGGFTQVALLGGAKKVIAVEKGTRQMRAPLRDDPRVELHEKTDIFDFICVAPDVVVADVSFISLKPILRHVRDKIVGEETEFLVMMKPQFEAEPWQLNRGVVKNERMRREIAKEFENWLKRNGFIIEGKRDNAVTGKNGNIERFYLLKIAKNR